MALPPAISSQLNELLGRHKGGALLIDAGVATAGFAALALVVAFALSDLALLFAPTHQVGKDRFELWVGGVDLVLVGLGLLLANVAAGALPVRAWSGLSVALTRSSSRCARSVVAAVSALATSVSPSSGTSGASSGTNQDIFSTTPKIGTCT